MSNKGAFTLVEMIVTLAIASLIVMGIAAAINIGNSYYGKLSHETGIYNDVSYGLKMMQNRVHSAKFLSVNTAGSPWSGQRLEVGNELFGIYVSGGNQDLVRLPDKANPNNREIILSVPAGGSLTLSLTQNGKAVSIRVYGSKYHIPFDVSSTVTRRI